MNGFQQAAALAPIPKYDKRYARAIAKWILNLANASRLFYWNELPQIQQDSYAWASENDPAACIPYESMKELWLGKSPFATGDALRGGWAATNLSLYSGSSVGYLAAVVHATTVPEILQIDLNKTDFYGDNDLASFLYFNPATVAQQVTVGLPPGTFGVYEAIKETVLLSAASGSINLLVPAAEVSLIRLFPAELTPEARKGRLYAGDAVLDYHFGYDFTATLRIKALATDRNPIQMNSVFTAYCEPGNTDPGTQVQYEWFLDTVLIAGKNQKQVQITAPGIPTQMLLKCRISANGQTIEDTIHLQIVDRIQIPPVVTGIQSGSKYAVAGGQNTFIAIVEPVQGESLMYAWSASAGSFPQPEGISTVWQAPSVPGVATITVCVTNQDQLSTTLSTGALVKDTTLAAQSPLIWYPFDAGDRNMAADRFHATATGVMKTNDARGLPGLAYRFTSGQDLIYTENNDALNFTDVVCLSCWVKCEQFGSERFILSHGSWQQRYKVSVTPEGLLRWTVKTNTGISDLDGSAPIGLNRYYHVTALYTGYSMELYVDGTLDTFKAFSGAILPSTKPFTIGRMDDLETQYAWRGSLDEVRLWDKEIPVKQIEQLMNQWAISPVDSVAGFILRIWPNPAETFLHIEFNATYDVENASLFSIEGKKIADYPGEMKSSAMSLEIPMTFTGVYVVRILLKDGRMAVRKVVARR